MRKRWFLVGIMFSLLSCLLVGCGVAQEKYDAVVSDLSKVQKDLQSIQAELGAAQAKNSELTTSLAKSQTELDELQSKNSELTTSLAKSQTELDELQSKNSELIISLQNVQSELEITNAELQDVQSEFETTKSELQDVQNEFETTKSELQATQLEVESLRRQLLMAAYSQEEINYFLEIALSSEWGGTHPLAKWSGEVRISVNGSPTGQDLTTLDSVIDEINELAGGQITLQGVDENPDITIWFVPLSEMPRYVPSYVPGNWGFFTVGWDSSYKIYRATILISTDKPTQQERSHLIREELTQSLGLLNDSWAYPDSIFYQGWTDVEEYSSIDRKVIEILYLEEIQCGMNREQIESILSY